MAVIVADHRGNDPSVLNRVITEEEWGQVWSGVEASGFWDMPTSSDYMGWDGTFLFLEVASLDKYCVVHRWFPEKSLHTWVSTLLCPKPLSLSNNGDASTTPSDLTAPATAHPRTQKTTKPSPWFLRMPYLLGPPMALGLT